MKKLILLFSASVFLTSLAPTANATLFYRSLGGGVDNALYDDELDITWLRDANLAATNTFGVNTVNPNGTMNWAEANAWINAMNAAAYLGQTNWRLPNILPINGISSNYNLTTRDNGTTDRGRNIARPGTAYAGSTQNELAHLFYDTLGNVSEYSVSGSDVDGCPGNASCLVNSGLFSNLQGAAHWSGQKSGQYHAMWFSFGNGYQNTALITEDRFVMAVIGGDVTPVPLPPAVWLLGTALLGLFGVTRKQRS